MIRYLIEYIYIDANNTVHSDQYIYIFAPNQNEAFITASGKLFAFFSNSTYKIRQITVTEMPG